MGLLSSRGFRNILLGAGSRYQELSKNALEIATEGQKNLREIAQNLDTVEKKAVKAMRVVEQQTDPVFSTFLGNKGIETLMEMDDETLRTYKEQYDQLSSNDLEKLKEQDAIDLKGESQKYYMDVAENMKKTVNIGNDSVNFLLDIDPRSKKFRKKVEEVGTVAPEFDLGQIPTVPTETLGFYGTTFTDSVQYATYLKEAQKLEINRQFLGDEKTDADKTKLLQFYKDEFDRTQGVKSFEDYLPKEDT